MVIYYIKGPLLILNLAPLYNKAVAKSEGNETARQVLAEQFRTLEQVSRVDGSAVADGSSAAMVCSYIFCGKPWTYAYAFISLVVGPVCAANCLQQYK